MRDVWRSLSGRSLAHDQITDKVRVSTAAVFSHSTYGGYYWQIETWIFSEAPRQRHSQIIHGTTYSDGVSEFNPESCTVLCLKAKHVHQQIADNMRTKFNEPQ